ncbi:YtpI family protein [Solibacillus sp. FSL H8-0538]|uniref:YtpI family protein n=1 Tax=Solibacillus sp. FSL H8-0538 TaxID=2921400 RepID=UPI0030FC9DCC
MLLNLIFVSFIVVSLVFYFYFKTKQFRATLPIRKKWYTAKAGVALGVFIIAFGLNATIIYPTLVGYGVAAVFFILGIGMSVNHFKRARHEGQYIQEEYELNK